MGAADKKEKKGLKFDFKIMLLLFALVPLFTAVIVISIILVSSSSKLIKETIHNYMFDVAKICGEELQEEIKIEGLDKALSAEALTDSFANITIEGVDGSYCYVVSKDGTMLFHPNAEKIGSSVENSVVLGLVADIKAGKAIAPSVVEYNYKGSVKYAGYYVNANQDYILVVTADEDVALAGVKKVTTIAVIVAICIVLFFVLVVLLIQKKITTPLKTITKNTELLSDGDLSEKETVSSNVDETNQLIAAYQKLQSELMTVISKAQSVANDLTSQSQEILELSSNAEDGSNQIAVAMEDLAQGATSLAENTQAISQQVVEISDIVNIISDNVSALSISSETIKTANDNASDRMNKVSISSGKSVDSVNRIVTQIAEQNESIEAISRAVDSIQSIAGQTNLLALNASIEAARAGEAGRGFAVVATEIGSLSEQSNSAAAEISQIVTEIINQSSISSKLAKEVGDVISEEQDYIKEATESFEALKTEIATSLEAIKTISGNMNSLESIRDVIATNVSDLGAISEENAASNEEVSASLSGIAGNVQQVSQMAGDISGLSNELNDTIAYFNK